MSLREVRASVAEAEIKQTKLRSMEKEAHALENARLVAKHNFARSKTVRKRALADLKAQEEYQNSVLKALDVELK
jgi:hypothetical protein